MFAESFESAIDTTIIAEKHLLTSLSDVYVEKIRCKRGKKHTRVIVFRSFFSMII